MKCRGFYGPVPRLEEFVEMFGRHPLAETLIDYGFRWGGVANVGDAVDVAGFGSRRSLCKACKAARILGARV